MTVRWLLSKVRQSRGSDTFADLVSCFVINLDSRPDRWQRMQRVCARRGVEPIRFSAHDREAGRQFFPDSRLGASELGVWSSFTAVVQSDVDTDWILVFEDDALLLPGFRHRVMKLIDGATSDVVTIRLGWLGRFAWRPPAGIGRYLYRTARTLIFDTWSSLRRQVDTSRSLASRYRFGAHAVLVRTSQVPRLLEAIGPSQGPLDVALIRAEASDPQRFTMAVRNLVWQWPSRSDIYRDRQARLS